MSLSSPTRSVTSSAVGLASLALVATLWGVGGVIAADDPSAPAPPVVVMLEVEGTINPAVDAYLADGLEHARAIGAEALLLRLDTPGGLVETTRMIVMQELGSDVPIIVWVGPEGARAASAGVFVTLAAHVAAMAPGTHIGAASPVVLGGVPTPDDKDKDRDEDARGDERGDAPPSPAPPSNEEAMQRKLFEDTRAFARSIAEARQRPVEWLELTVTEARSSTAHEALDAGAIDLIARDVEQVLAAIDGRVVQTSAGERTLHTQGARIEAFEMGLGQKLLHAIAHPTLAYLLLLFAMVAIYFELAQPGGFVLGTFGAIALILAIIAFQILPFDFGGLILVLLGVGLLVAEAYLPSGGILAVGGTIALIVGSLFLFDTPDLDVRPSPWLIAGVSASFAACVVAAGMLVMRAHRRPSLVGNEAMVGISGVALTALAPTGKVEVRGELWDAIAEGNITQGTAIEITQVDGLSLRVRPRASTPVDAPTNGSTREPNAR